MQLNFYKLKNFSKRIGAGVCDSWFIEMGAVAKTNVVNAPYCIPNEIICSDIGRFLRLPIPPSGIVHTPALTPQEYWFASLDFNLSGNAPPPANAPRCAMELPDLSTGLIVFDILIGNFDRHTGNLAVEFPPIGDPQMNVFDHSHALLGYQPGQGENFLRTTIADPRIPNHCLSGHLQSGMFFQKWIDRIREIPDFLIRESAETAMTFGASHPEYLAIIDFLTYRRNNINDLINANQANFLTLTPWRPV